MDIIISCCGCVCSDCKFFGNTCKGCGAEKGAPYWVAYAELNTCPIYSCCISERKYKKCSECGELPCYNYYDMKDPSMTDEEHNKTVVDRIKTLKGKK